MSDEPSRTARTVPVAGIWEHYCQHAGCKEWGNYGYQIGKQTPHCSAVSTENTASGSWEGGPPSR